MSEQKMQNEVHIKISTDGIEFDAKGDADFIERERTAFEAKLLPLGVDAVSRTRRPELVPQVIPQEEYQALPASNIAVSHNSQSEVIDWSKTSLASFVKKKGADAHYDFILCAAFYNEKKHGTSSFSSVSIKQWYSEAKKVVPKNISMSLSELVKKGYIMEPPEIQNANPKEYMLTSDGEQYVQSFQPSEEKKTPTRQRKARVTTESEYVKLNIDDLNRGNYPDLASLKGSKEKMMMALYMVTSEKQGEWFTVNDIVFILKNKLGETVNAKQVKNNCERNPRWFDTAKKEGSREVQRKLLNEGKKFAKDLIAKKD